MMMMMVVVVVPEIQDYGRFLYLHHCTSESSEGTPDFRFLWQFYLPSNFNIIPLCINSPCGDRGKE